MKSPAFQFYPKDFLTAQEVSLMRLDEIGAYVVLLCHDWIEGSIPTDRAKLARLCKVTDADMERIWSAVEGCFDVDKKDASRATNPRLAKERKKQREWARKSAEGGRRSGMSRRKKDLPQEPEANHPSTTTPTNDEPNTNSSSSFSSTTPVKEETEPSFGRAQSLRLFEERFWPVVWAKIGKGAARNAWLHRIKSADMAERVIAAAVAQGPGLLKHAMQNGHSVLHPATWLNQERYDDEPSLALDRPTAVDSIDAKQRKSDEVFWAIFNRDRERAEADDKVHA